MPGEEGGDITTRVQELDTEDQEAGFSDDDGELDEMLANEAEEEVSSQKALLSKDQKARAEKNKLKALALRKARVQAAPYSKEKDHAGGKPKRKEDKKLVDGGGGFFIEEEDDEEQAGDTVAESLPPPLMPPDQPDCEQCAKPFATSHLLRTFDHPACDECKNMEKDGPHQLITKTDAKREFLLKDTDFEKGERDEPFVPLKFVLRKNPHNPRWGDMKLFLRTQVETRALQVWGTEEALEAEHEAREERQVMAKSKKYEKKMKELRKTVRSSLFTKDLAAHIHSFGEEIYNEETDEYSKTCSTCSQTQTYEKM